MSQNVCLQTSQIEREKKEEKTFRTEEQTNEKIDSVLFWWNSLILTSIMNCTIRIYLGLHWFVNLDDINGLHQFLSFSIQPTPPTWANAKLQKKMNQSNLWKMAMFSRLSLTLHKSIHWNVYVMRKYTSKTKGNDADDFEAWKPHQFDDYISEHFMKYIIIKWRFWTRGRLCRCNGFLSSDYAAKWLVINGSSSQCF